MGKTREKIVLVILDIELLVLAVLLVLLFVPRKTYSLDSVNNTIKLPYGHYYITCNYEIPEKLDTVNSLYILNSEGTTDGITQIRNFLNEEHNSYTSEFWINDICRQITINVNEFDKQDESDSIIVKEYKIVCTSYGTFIGLLVLAVGILITVTIYLITSGKVCLKRKNIINIVILSVTVLISCIPLCGKELLIGDDTMIHLIRLEGIKDGYLAGQIPVKVEPTFNGGYGYAFSTYYGSLYYNIPAFLRFMGFSIINAYKAYVIIVNIATSIIAFYSFKVILKNEKCALLGGVLYTLSLYRLYDLYQRGAVGEYTAMIFLPLIAAGLWKIYNTPVEDKGYSRLWIMPVIGYSGVIESHILSTELYGAFTILLCLIMVKKTFRKKTFAVLLKIVFITAILNIGFILPFVESYIGEKTVISENMLAEPVLSQGLDIVDLFKFYTGGNENPWWRTYIRGGLGPAFLIVIVLSVYTIIRKIDRKYKKLFIVTGIITMVSLTFTLNIFPWEKIIEPMYYGIGTFRIVNALLKKACMFIINVQFKIRFMIVGVLTYTVYTCVILLQKDDDGILKFSKILIVMLTVIQFIWAGAFIMLKGERTDLYTISPEDKKVTCNLGNYEYIPLKGDGEMPYIDSFMKPLSCLSTNAEVSDFYKKYTNVYVHVKTDDNIVGIIEMPLLYYRGYEAVDIDTGRKMPVFNSSSNARVGVVIEGGYEGNIKVYYTGKTTWHIAELISCATFIIILVYGFNFRKRQKLLGK